MTTPSPYGKSRSRSVWTVLAVAVGASLAVGGLLVVGFYVIVVAGMSHFGSNK